MTSEWAILFPGRYAHAQHPVYPKAHPSGWVSCTAEDLTEAWCQAEMHFLGYWRAVVPLAEVDPLEYPLGEIGRL